MILFLVGKDRPGIVDEVSLLLFENGANIEDSRMATLGGRFAIMTLFSSSAKQLAAIQADLERLKALGFEISLHDAEDPALVRQRAELPLTIEVRAMDHPGIVQKVVHILNRHEVNIENLETAVTRAPLSGAPIFDLVLVAAIPAEKPVGIVKEELNELARGMNLDLNFKK